MDLHWSCDCTAHSSILSIDSVSVALQLQNVIDQTPKKDILVVQGDSNAKEGRDACGDWQGFCGPF